jgi:hypothetical protein
MPSYYKPNTMKGQSELFETAWSSRATVGDRESKYGAGYLTNFLR